MRTLAACGLFALCLCGCPTPTEPAAPKAAFSADFVYGKAPLAVQFSDLSTAGASPITAWYWNFGDAQTAQEASPLHTYTSVGKFTVTLRVVSATGDGILSQDKLIEVIAPLVPPKAHFSADPQSGSAPLAVHFTDESTRGDRPITTWRWDFGDGGKSTLQNPTHSYAATGVYSVTLRVSNGLGESVFAEDALIHVLAQ